MDLLISLLFVLWVEDRSVILSDLEISKPAVSALRFNPTAVDRAVAVGGGTETAASHLGGGTGTAAADI